MPRTLLVEGAVGGVQGREGRRQGAFGDGTFLVEKVLHRLHATYHGGGSEEQRGSEHRSVPPGALGDEVIGIPQVGEGFPDADEQTLAAGEWAERVSCRHLALALFCLTVWMGSRRCGVFRSGRSP